MPDDRINEKDVGPSILCQGYKPWEFSRRNFDNKASCILLQKEQEIELSILWKEILVSPQIRDDEERSDMVVKVMSQLGNQTVRDGFVINEEYIFLPQFGNDFFRQYTPKVNLLIVD